jgi:hypothetical protein
LHMELIDVLVVCCFSIDLACRRSKFVDAPDISIVWDCVDLGWGTGLRDAEMKDAEKKKADEEKEKAKKKAEQKAADIQKTLQAERRQ